MRFDRNGAPDRSLAHGNCPKYVMMARSLMLSFFNSWGFTNIWISSHSSASSIASSMQLNDLSSCWTMHSPGAIDSINATTALPCVQLLVKLMIERCGSFCWIHDKSLFSWSFTCGVQNAVETKGVWTLQNSSYFIELTWIAYPSLATSNEISSSFGYPSSNNAAYTEYRKIIVQTKAKMLANSPSTILFASEDTENRCHKLFPNQNTEQGIV